MTPKHLDNIFTYHAPTEGQPEKYEAIRASGKSFAALLLDLCPDSRERSIAIRKIEEACMWANASIARNG